MRLAYPGGGPLVSSKTRAVGRNGMEARSRRRWGLGPPRKFDAPCVQSGRQQDEMSGRDIRNPESGYIALFPGVP